MKIDGVEIHIEGTGPTVMMIHGWPDTYRLWDGTVAALKDRFRCIRFTLPGYDAAHAQRARSLPELIEFFRTVATQAAPGEKVALLLHDWGCVFGYQFYNRHPELVSRIVGVDIGDSVSLKKVLTPRDGFLILGYQWWLALAWKIGGRIGTWMTRYMAKRAHCPADPASIDVRMSYPYHVLWMEPPERFRGLIREFKPAVPFLFIYGRKKPFQFQAPAWIEWVKSQPKNTVEPFDTNHWVMIQDPARFNAVVKGWLERTPA